MQRRQPKKIGKIKNYKVAGECRVMAKKTNKQANEYSDAENDMVDMTQQMFATDASDRPRTYCIRTKTGL